MSYMLYDMIRSPATQRINARLDEALARKVDLLRRRTGRTVSQIVQESLARYCDETLGREDDPLSVLKRAGFVGCADGPADLSKTYKHKLAQSLQSKV